MATITASATGGDRNWTTGATWMGGVAPTAADDAVLSATSGPVTINAGAVCRSLDTNLYASTLTHSAAVTLTIGDATAGAGNIALRFGTTTTYTLGNATTSAITFVSTSATVQDVNFAGKTTGNVTYNGAGGSWRLVGTHNTGATASVTLTAGTLDTNGQTWSWGLFSSSGTGTRTLTLGASAGTLSGTVGTIWNTSTNTNLTFNSNTSTVTLSGSGACNFAPGGVSFNNLTRTGTAVKTDSWSYTGNVTVTGTLTLNANSLVNSLMVQSSVVGTARTITAATLVATNCICFCDITGAGAATWTTGASGATSFGDCQGNSGITFTTAATQTHTASAGGNWSDATKWTSRVPLPQDNVIVDGNTTGTLTADMPRLGANLTFTGFAGVLAWGTTNSLYGNLTLGSTMGTMTGTSATTLAGRGAQTLTSAGKTFSQPLTQNGPTGTYTLADALLTSLALVVTGGTLSAATFNVTALTFSMGNALGAISMGTGTWSVTQTTAVTVWSVTAGTVTASTSNIVLSSASANTRTFAGGGQTYGTLTYTVAASTGILVLTGSNTFAALAVSGGVRTVNFTAGTTQTISTAAGWQVNGAAGPARVICQSTTGGTAWNLSVASGTVSCDWLTLQDSNATGGASFYAGANSTNTSGNTGWTFTGLSFSDSPSGSLTASGSQSESLSSSSTVSGTVTLSVVASEALTLADSPSATLTADGTVTELVTWEDSLSGSLAVDGLVAESYSQPPPPLQGTLTLAGHMRESQASYDVDETATSTVSGASTYDEEY